MASIGRASVLALTLVLIGVQAGQGGSVQEYVERWDKLGDVVKVPPFEGQDIRGNTLRSSELMGKKTVLVAFWSMYCKACLEKFDSLVKIRAKYLPERLEVLSVNTDAEYQLPNSTIAEFIKGLEYKEGIKINFPVIYQGGDALAKKLGISFLPAIITVDQDTRIVGVYRRFSEESDDEILRGIEAIIPEAAREPPP